MVSFFGKFTNYFPIFDFKSKSNVKMIKSNQVDQKVLKVTTKEKLRSLSDHTGVFSDKFYLEDLKEEFYYDPTDTTTPDNSVDVFVNIATGRRYKLWQSPTLTSEINNISNVKIPDAVSDRLPYMNINELVSYPSSLGYIDIQITDVGKEGIFTYDPSDTTSLHDGVLVITNTNTGKRYKRQFKGSADIRWWGVTSNSSASTGSGTDLQSTFWKALSSGVKDITIPKGDYLFSVFQGNQGVNIRGESGTKIYLKRSGSSTPSMVQFASNTSISNIDFISLEPDFEGSRTNIDGKENIKIENCTFTGFRDTTGAINAWGVYLKNSKRIKLINCGFSNNSQSDLAIVDNNSYITIDSCYSTTEPDGIHLNIEPNGTLKNSNITVINTDMRQADLLENSLTVYSSTNVTFIGCNIHNLTYDGSGVEFISTTVDNIASYRIIEATPANRTIYAGDFKSKLVLSENLLSDTKIIDFAQPSTTTYWSTVFINSFSVSREEENGIRFVRLNSGRSSTAYSIQTRNTIPVSPGGDYSLFMNSRVVTSSSDGFIGNDIRIYQYDSTGELIPNSIIYIAFNRCLAGEQNTFSNRWGFFKVRSDCHSVRVYLGRASTSTYCYDIRGIGLFKVSNIGIGESSDVIADKCINPEVLKMNTIPLSANYPDFFKGDIIERINIADFSWYRYICVDAGKGSNASFRRLLLSYNEFSTGKPSDPLGDNGMSYHNLGQGVTYRRYSGKWIPENVRKVNSITFDNATPQSYDRDEVYVYTRTGNTVTNLPVITDTLPAGLSRQYINNTTGRLNILKAVGVNIINHNKNITLLSNGDSVEIFTTGTKDEYVVMRANLSTYIDSSITSTQTSSTLDILYPNVLSGQKILATNLDDGVLFEKVNSGWIISEGVNLLS